MPNYSFAAGSNPTYSSWATPSGGTFGGDIITASGKPFNSGLTTGGWLPPEGYWTDENNLVNGDLALRGRVARRTGQEDPTGTGMGRTSRYSGGAGAGGAGVGTVEVPGSNGLRINPNDPNQRYQPVDIVKSPMVAGAVGDLMESFKKGAADSLAGFDDHLKTFRTSLDNAFNRQNAAADPSATISELRRRQAGYDSEIGQTRADYLNSNAEAAARERAVAQDARDSLGLYDSATDAATNLALQQAQKRISRYKAGGGAPSGLSSDEIQMLHAADANILVPMAQAKINRRYSNMSQFDLPIEQDIASREQMRIGSFTPQMIAAQFQSGQATAQTIQALLEHTSNMSMQNAVQYMQALGVPAEIQQRILSGQITQLGQLGEIEDRSRYRGLQDTLGVNPTQPQYFSPATGSYPMPSRYNSGGGGSRLDVDALARAISGGRAPSTVPATVPGGAGRYAGVGNAGAPAGAQGDWVWDANNKRWQNWRTGDISSTGPYAGGAAGGGDSSYWGIDNNPNLDMPLSSPVYQS